MGRDRLVGLPPRPWLRSLVVHRRQNWLVLSAFVHSSRFSVAGGRGSLVATPPCWSVVLRR
eukprot:2442934-Alexandrium_andersonii.AAC.1